MTYPYIVYYGRLGLIDRINIISNNIILFHEYCLALIITILLRVCVISYLILPIKRILPIHILYNASIVETTWTILPIFFLISLRGPCFYILYVLEREKKYELTVKTIRHQWYWSYEREDLLSFNFDSYIKNLEDLKKRENRLLEVDNSLNLPFNSHIRMCITSRDVLHSWALPNLAIKADATPGRLNILNLHSNVPRSIYRQCSEICRINHSFIPIHVEFSSWEDSLKCYSSFL